jgi:indolepyruvate decarboxylase
MQDGVYNNLLAWNYSRLPEVLGIGRGFVVKTEEELDRALEAAGESRESYCLLDVHLDPMDRSPALQRLAERLSRRLQGRQRPV